ncbi:MAG: hypothetical protein NY202_05155 [Mollicutes bacterium UO1]
MKLEFDFNTNQVVIKCNNNKQISITDGGLSTKQQEEITQQLKSTGESITFNQISDELNKGNKKGKNGNAGIIGAIIIVGIISVVVIGVIIHRNKKREY